ncbi:hypothetical protein GOODEAATRI_012235, partial [Goodea atripinnis]
ALADTLSSFHIKSGSHLSFIICASRGAAGCRVPLKRAFTFPAASKHRGGVSDSGVQGRIQAWGPSLLFCQEF